MRAGARSYKTIWSIFLMLLAISLVNCLGSDDESGLQPNQGSVSKCAELSLTTAPSSAEEAETISTDCGSELLASLWTEQIQPGIDALDISSESQLYDAQYRLMFPTHAVFELQETEYQSGLIQLATKTVQSLPSVAELVATIDSEGAPVSPSLQIEIDASRTERRLFPTKDATGTYFDSRLSTLQFSSWLSAMAAYCATSPLAECEDLVRTLVPFLVKDVVDSYWNDIPAWQYNRANYPNMKERVAAKLNYLDDPFYSQKSYYRAFWDMELFLFAIASDLHFVQKIYPDLFEESDRSLVGELRITIIDVVNQRVASNSGNPFLFDPGVWDDHPDFYYYAYYGDELPTSRQPGINVSWDSSHASRWPWWLLSYRRAHEVDSQEWTQFHGYLQGLAQQMEQNVIHYQGETPLLTNYMNGNNGWYRFRESHGWGYGAFTLTRTSTYGPWLRLEEFQSSLSRYRESLANTVLSENPAVVQLRTLYYGERYADEPDQSGLRDTDLMGWGSYPHLVIYLANQLRR